MFNIKNKLERLFCNHDYKIVFMSNVIDFNKEKTMVSKQCTKCKKKKLSLY